MIIVFIKNTKVVKNTEFSDFTASDGQRSGCRTNELIFHLLHFPNETVTGAMKSRGTCSTFPAKP